MLWRLLGLVPVRGICPGVSLDWFSFEEYALASPWIGSRSRNMAQRAERANASSGAFGASAEEGSREKSGRECGS
eukprot:5930708-Pyramimonas_sp.AAC.1